MPNRRPTVINNLFPIHLKFRGSSPLLLDGRLALSQAMHDWLHSSSLRVRFIVKNITLQKASLCMQSL
jgi:hypothetical protein